MQVVSTLPACLYCCTAVPSARVPVWVLLHECCTQLIELCLHPAVRGAAQQDKLAPTLHSAAGSVLDQVDALSVCVGDMSSMLMRWCPDWRGGGMGSMLIRWMPGVCVWGGGVREEGVRV